MYINKKDMRIYKLLAKGLSKEQIAKKIGQGVDRVEDAIRRKRER